MFLREETVRKEGLSKLRTMQLQYLNGISLGATQTLFDSVQHQLLHTKADVDSVVGGFDLDNYEGLNTASDTEKLRNYLIRTKRIADQSPALIQSMRNPETFSQMCAFGLRKTKKPISLL